MRICYWCKRNVHVCTVWLIPIRLVILKKKIVNFLSIVSFKLKNGRFYKQCFCFHNLRLIEYFENNNRIYIFCSKTHLMGTFWRFLPFRLEWPFLCERVIHFLKQYKWWSPNRIVKRLDVFADKRTTKIITGKCHRLTGFYRKVREISLKRPEMQ